MTKFLCHFQGEIQCRNFSDVEVFDFLTQKCEIIKPETQTHNSRLRGHNGADFYIMDAFVKAVAVSTILFRLQ